MTDKNISTDAPEDTESLTFGQRAVSEAKFFAGLIAFIFLFQTLIFGHFKIPSESMLPTLEVGDHLYVSKFAYGYNKNSIPLIGDKLPLGEGIWFSRVPKRGDVVVFRNPNDGIVMIKRAVGLPGDEINVKLGRYYLNGTMIERTPLDDFLYREHKGLVVGVDEYSEQWPGEKQAHRIYEQTDDGPHDNVGPFLVPEGMIFFMGDNRDNSDDSRAENGPGMVPLNYLMGRADLMMFSLHRCKKEQGLRCPPRRFLLPL